MGDMDEDTSFQRKLESLFVCPSAPKAGRFQLSLE
jgi:hypothetical protein